MRAAEAPKSEDSGGEDSLPGLGLSIPCCTLSRPPHPPPLVRMECYSGTGFFVPLLLVLKSNCNYAACQAPKEADHGETQALIQMRKGFPEAAGKSSTAVKLEDFLP